MRKMRTASIVLIVVVAIICAAAAVAFGTDILQLEQKTQLAQNTAVPQSTDTPSPAPTAQPTPSPTQVPQKPKYIFYVIGDGMGFSHLDLGRAYEKILHKDSSYDAYWDRFGMVKSVVAGRESAGGGTMLATGYNGEQDMISVTSDGTPLYTILDRAKEVGMATGVISNSYITDATPSTFLVHVNERSDYKNIVRQLPESGVNYIASGGLDYFISDGLYDIFGKYDIRGTKYNYKGEEGALDAIENAGYGMYLAKDAADFANQNMVQSYDGDDLFMLYVSKNMSYRHSKYGSRRERLAIDEPDLDDMTRIGIDLLSRDEDGFVFVIEEALIDKASHNLWMEITSGEMHALNQTLETIFDFYSKHPYETLIILTADHETGDMSANPNFLDKISLFSDIDYTLPAPELKSFLSAEWGLDLDTDKLADKQSAAALELWESDEKNYTLLHTYIAAELCRTNGIEITSKYHSRQEVPLFAEGVSAAEFSACDNIYDIAPLICDIMGWETLPEEMKRE